MAYRQVALISKPILLLYSFERLASVLIEAKIPNAPVRRNHGIEYKEGKIKLRKEGLFKYFHNCYFTDNSICENEISFTLENLIGKDLPIRENDIEGIFEREGQTFLLVRVAHETSTQGIVLHELDREFLFVFALASLSRYNIIQWSKLLEGKESGLIVEIQRYLKSIETFFPLILQQGLNSSRECIVCQSMITVFFRLMPP